MGFVKFLALVTVLFILVFVIAKITNKIFGDTEENILDTPGKTIYRWGRTAILIIFLISLWFWNASDSDTLRMLCWMIYLTLLFGFRAIMELIYLRKSKQYISTTISLIAVLVAIYIVYNNPFWG